MAAGRSSNGSGVNWGTLIAAVMLAVALVGAFWTIVQTQFGYIEKDKETIRGELVRSLANIQSQFGEGRAALEARRALSVEQVEFKQFEASILRDVATVKQQLLLLEQTRPTTGELQTAARGLEGRIDQQERRLQNLENQKMGGR